MTIGSDTVVSVAQVAAGGTIVQALVALFRRRGELRQLDRQTESVAVETADHLVTMLRRELVEAKNEIARLKRERSRAEREIDALTERVSLMRAELAQAQAELAGVRADHHSE